MRHGSLLGLSLAVLAGCASEPSPTLTLEARDNRTAWFETVASATVLQVTVRADGLPVAGVTVFWSTNDGSLGTRTSVSDAAGVASTPWVLGTVAGQQRATASLAAPSVEIEFQVTALPGPAASIEKLAGDRQAFQLRDTADSLKALVVRVLDAYGNPNPGISVAWSVVSGPTVSFSPPRAVSEGGQAVLLQGLAQPGMIQVRAAVAGTAIEKEFEVEVQPSDWLVVIEVQAPLTPVFRVVSVQNNASPPVDTIPVGARMQWRNTGPFYFGGYLVHSIGPISFADCIVGARRGDYCRIQFTEPGVYQYEINLDDPDWLLVGKIGTIIVR
jgi:hypothetical protein